MKRKNFIYIIIIIILVAVLCVGVKAVIDETSGTATTSETTKNDNQNLSKKENGGSGLNSSSSSVDKTGVQEFTEDEEVSDKEYISESSDENAVIVKDGAKVSIKKSKIKKSTGDTTNTENSEFYGVNAGILVEEDSSATIEDAEITTSAKGANAVFSTGSNSKISISNSKIKTTSNSSRGLDATYSGYIEADNVDISTQGISCATLATDRGEGTVTAKNSNLSTAGQGSPIIYSTGGITIENTTGEATGAQMVVIEGKNTANVTDSELKCSAKGNRNDVDNCGIMIYQSMSGDAGEGTGTFNATNSTLSIATDSSLYQTAPFFFITNTSAVINLENNILNYGSGLLLKAIGTDEWGKAGNNGGNVTLNAINQKLTGNIETDDISSVVLNLKDNSSLEGTINSENTAKSIELNLDSSSKLTLTGDCYVTSLNDETSDYSNIDFNGYTLYVGGIPLK